MSKKLTYKDAGVDINEANETKRTFKKFLNSKNKSLLNNQQSFASLYNFSFQKYKNPVLVLKTEEPGSKQLLALKNNRYESICYDMVNHLINDCIVMGAKPLTIQDCIVCGKLEKNKVTRMVKAMADACKEQGCILTGGETSEQPGIISKGTYILSSSIVGIVDKTKIIDGHKIKARDDIIGLASSGVHTNGYSLIRAILTRYPSSANNKIDGIKFIDLLLEPHRCYYLPLKELFPSGRIKGMAHITGGGIKENLNRILPRDLNAVIDLGKIQKIGKITDAEMLRTFNLGVGLALVCNSKNTDSIITHIKKNGVHAYKIGVTASGKGQVTTKGKLNF